MMLNNLKALDLQTVPDSRERKKSRKVIAMKIPGINFYSLYVTHEFSLL